MPDLTLVPLGDRGEEYLSNRLRQGEGLCGGLLELVSKTPGSVSAAFPSQRSPGRAYDLDVGGLMSMSASQTWLGRHLASRAKEEEGFVILQDLWAKPSDIRLNDRSLNIINGKIYYIIDNGDITTNFARAIVAVRSFSVVGAFIRSCTCQHQIDSRWLDKSSENAFEIFTDAYDQEGFVIWQRH